MFQSIKIIFYSGCALIIFCVAGAHAFDNETLEMKPFVKSKIYCNKCHSKKEVQNKIKNPWETCATFCKTCHNHVENHHKFGIRIEKDILKKLKLTKNNKITCITCHTLKRNRYDSSSWKAVSLYEKIFIGKSKYKTFYLIIKNNNGQLCKICH